MLKQVIKGGPCVPKSSFPNSGNCDNHTGMVQNKFNMEGWPTESKARKRWVTLITVI